MKQAIAYLRVSTEEQVDNFSLETQEAICRKEAAKRKLQLEKIFTEEGKSAKTISGRPALLQLFEYCRHNKSTIDALIVYRLDRLSRQTADYLAIRKKLADLNITLYSATEPTGDSPTEKLVETILAGFAQLDNDVRAERSRNGMRARFMAGHLNGKAPLGYLLEDGVVVKDPKTWDDLKSAWDLMATGTKSLRDMADYMNGLGLRYIRRSKQYKLRPQSAHRIFRHNFYAGILTSKTYDLAVKGKHPPMITLAQFNLVQDILDGRKSKTLPVIKRVQDNPDFPLRRIVKCGQGGTGLTGAWSTGRRAKFAYYRCGKPCNHKSIPRQAVHYEFVKALKKIQPKPQTVELFEYLLAQRFQERNQKLLERKRTVNLEIEKAELEKKKIVKKHLEDIYSDEIYQEQMAMAESRLQKLAALNSDSLFNEYRLPAFTKMLNSKLNRLDKLFQKLSSSQLRVLLSLVFNDILMWNYENGLKTSYFKLWQKIKDPTLSKN